ncbi:hypothetical protein QL285_067648 [Trifolium repens]|nr:hypothetical protein QL285_067648 [Trifolium repens]
MHHHLPRQHCHCNSPTPPPNLTSRPKPRSSTATKHHNRRTPNTTAPLQPQTPQPHPSRQHEDEILHRRDKTLPPEPPKRTAPTACVIVGEPTPTPI